MKAVLLTGAGVAVVDGVVLGVALGVGSTTVAATALAVGLACAVVLGWLTPAGPVPEHTLVTLGTPPTAEPAEPDAPDALMAHPGAVPALPERTPVPRHALVTSAAV
ncbi:hypothetical protein Xcel_3110 [Xylanimonas cellulosilytica DSM 15894]|uniref:Uncharacterized protein n=1 Tax=Xylanimonas cellulosilytica (strain DSM 15894 / JCM 12276 / CECT 5975 / KCTC 9989 / LMG 20990 / NBRC 107835 / XIL07) TaxID=446471 RepID=D1BZY3_XYLCX|nr:hypothetical protein [Xylanimonas cellulosilytica]ACZ32111.1 hypothetical protein Xcel_3110 [Xylanimonas cellulosilytica DSM 15894]